MTFQIDSAPRNREMLESESSLTIVRHTLHHSREQRPVGQGGFHTAQLSLDGATPFRWVYDCGSMQGPIRSEVELYLRELPEDAEIDAVFISHFHADHINGLERLLGIKDGARARRVFLPFLDGVDRLLAVSSSLSRRELSQLESVYLVDGGRGLEDELNVARVYEVVRSDADLDPQTTSDSNALDDFTESQANSNLQVALTVGGSGPRGSQSRVIATDQALVVLSREGMRLWEFRWHVNPQIRKFRDEFLDRLSTEPTVRSEVGGGSLEVWLSSAENLRILLTKKDLKSAVARSYLAVNSDLNRINLSLWSGPPDSPAVVLPARRRHTGFGRRVPIWSHDFWHPHRVAWLGTGDAKLSGEAACADFGSHFGSLLDDLATFVVPHHGSNEDFSEHAASILKAAEVAVVPYGTRNTYGHPGAHVAKLLLVTGLLTVGVTDHPETRWREIFQLIYLR